MNSLSIDIGNTRSKYELWGDEGYLMEFDNPKLHMLPDLIKKYEIEGVIVSSVNQNPEGLIGFLKEGTKSRIVHFDHNEIKKYGHKIKYRGSVGADRIAAYLGTLCLPAKGGALVADLGTALTLDVVDKDENFCGGTISLGLNTRMKALASSTKRLPEITDAGEYRAFGCDTQSCIAAGAINGVLGEIQFAAERARHEFDVRYTVFTGGDGEKIYKLFKDESESLYDPHLVGRGLDRHLRVNYFRDCSLS